MYSITDMCCCQLAAAVAHLLPVLNSSCLCFVAPKQGPDSGTQKWGHKTKMGFQICGLNCGPMVHGICVLPPVKGALSCDRLHLSSMFSCTWCQDAGFTVCIYVYMHMYIRIYVYMYMYLCIYVYMYIYVYM